MASEENFKIATALSKNERVREWLQQGDDIDDASSVISSIVDSEDLQDGIKSISLGTTSEKNTFTSASSATDIIAVLQNITNNAQNLSNVVIQNSSGVHIGHVFNFNINGESKTETANEKALDSSSEEEPEERNNQDLFINKNIKRDLPAECLRYVDRREWLAQRPMEPPKKLNRPVSYVIISHTASESGTTIADNKFLIRHVQCFHIESRNFNDIAYNFLIGCDGVVYEGRNWGVEGAHTYGFNRKSVGISFVGCFMRELPPKCSLDVCKVLIKKGVDEGYIAKDYKLKAHCQCSATESPGRALYEELQTWPNFSSD